MKKIAIIGGGPAGLMAASTILESTNVNEKYRIILYEGNNSLGKKLLISGGGRCNVTTGVTKKKILETKYIRGWDFFRHSLGKFSPKKCIEWFESSGLPLKIQDDERVFPSSDNGNDVLRIFERKLENSKKIQICFRTKITKIQRNPDKENFLLYTDGGIFEADIVLIATGGNAYAQTGSRGDGYSFARELWHTITELWPSLSSFLLKESFIKNLSGISFSRSKIVFSSGNEEKNLFGSLLFTHFGISGPLAFMLSSHLAWENIENFPLKIVPIADMDAKNWDFFLQEFFKNHPKKMLFSALKEKLPARFSSEIIREFFAEYENIFLSQISAKTRKELADLLGNGIFATILQRRPGDEFVTAGGVNTDEVNAETMESKIEKNLFFAGEILNIDGYTGGFSLQICWSTGRAAGKTIAQRVGESFMDAKK